MTIRWLRDTNLCLDDKSVYLSFTLCRLDCPKHN